MSDIKRGAATRCGWNEMNLFWGSGKSLSYESRHEASDQPPNASRLSSFVIYNFRTVQTSQAARNPQ